MQSYIDMLIGRLHQEAASHRETADIFRWFNYTTFDIIGDLAFGESFDCLSNNRYHPWVTLFFESVQIATFMRIILIYPLLALLVTWIIPKSIKEKSDKHYQMSQEKVNRRLATKPDRPDFTSCILRYSDERGMTRREIESNATFLIIAGNEMTGTTLAGCIYCLLTHPHAYSRLVNEIRGSFRSQDDITILFSAKVPYLYGILEETLRLYPPTPGIIPRRVSKGCAVVNGEFVPEGTSVSVAYYSAFRARSNFMDPAPFIPERGLEGRDPKFASDNRDAFQKFSYRPRNCLGKNMA